MKLHAAYGVFRWLDVTGNLSLPASLRASWDT
jgi:hypothetical protein